MKAVKAYTKNDYIANCKEENGEVFKFKQWTRLPDILQNLRLIFQKKKLSQELRTILIAIGFSLKMEVLFLNTTEKDTTKQL